MVALKMMMMMMIMIICVSCESLLCDDDGYYASTPVQLEERINKSFSVVDQLHCGSEPVLDAATAYDYRCFCDHTVKLLEGFSALLFAEGSLLPRR
jgi:hypothetical protein